MLHSMLIGVEFGDIAFLLLSSIVILAAMIWRFAMTTRWETFSAG